MSRIISNIFEAKCALIAAEQPAKRKAAAAALAPNKRKQQQQGKEAAVAAVAAANAGEHEDDGQQAARHHHKHKHHHSKTKQQAQKKKRSTKRDTRPHYGNMTGPSEEDVWQSDDSDKVGCIQPVLKVTSARTCLRVSSPLHWWLRADLTGLLARAVVLCCSWPVSSVNASGQGGCGTRPQQSFPAWIMEPAPEFAAVC